MLIAIAGGAGAGKSAVSEIIKKEGFTVISADDINRTLLADPEYREKLKAVFPQAVKNGAVDKKEIRNIIFNDEEKRMALNRLAHPLIIKRLQERAAKESGVVFAEIPLLIESGLQRKFDRIWAVDTEYKVRIGRIMERDGISESSAAAVLESQKKEEKVYEIADTVIRNSGNLTMLNSIVKGLLKSLR